MTTLAGKQASVSIVGAVSPPGGDFSEPVTQHTRRFIRCFWALDTELANARHYPIYPLAAVLLRVYRGRGNMVEENGPGLDGPAHRSIDAAAAGRPPTADRQTRRARYALPDAQRLILFVAEIMKDGFLTQNSFDEVDMYCAPERQIALLRMILMIFRKGPRPHPAGGAPRRASAPFPAFPR